MLIVRRFVNRLAIIKGNFVESVVVERLFIYVRVRAYHNIICIIMIGDVELVLRNVTIYDTNFGSQMLILYRRICCEIATKCAKFILNKC